MSLARTTDPVTSHLAAEQVRPATSQAAVLWVAKQMVDFTDSELLDAYASAVSRGKVSPFTPSRIRTARAELVRQGLLRDTERTRPSEFGREMTVWSVT